MSQTVPPTVPPSSPPPPPKFRDLSDLLEDSGNVAPPSATVSGRPLALGGEIIIRGLTSTSPSSAFTQLKALVIKCAEDIPSLLPVVCTPADAKQGAVDYAYLRLDASKTPDAATLIAPLDAWGDALNLQGVVADVSPCVGVDKVRQLKFRCTPLEVPSLKLALAFNGYPHLSYVSSREEFSTVTLLDKRHVLTVLNHGGVQSADKSQSFEAVPIKAVSPRIYFEVGITNCNRVTGAEAVRAVLHPILINHFHDSFLFARSTLNDDVLGIGFTNWDAACDLISNPQIISDACPDDAWRALSQPRLLYYLNGNGMFIRSSDSGASSTGYQTRVAIDQLQRQQQDWTASANRRFEENATSVRTEFRELRKDISTMGRNFAGLNSTVGKIGTALLGVVGSVTYISMAGEITDDISNESIRLLQPGVSDDTRAEINDNVRVLQAERRTLRADSKMRLDQIMGTITDASPHALAAPDEDNMDMDDDEAIDSALGAQVSCLSSSDLHARDASLSFALELSAPASNVISPPDLVRSPIAGVMVDSHSGYPMMASVGISPLAKRPRHDSRSERSSLSFSLSLFLSLFVSLLSRISEGFYGQTTLVLYLFSYILSYASSIVPALPRTPPRRSKPPWSATTTCFILPLLFLFSLAPACGAVHTYGFTVLSMNTNGFASPYKINNFATLVNRHQPHAFVINETKSPQPAAPRLKMPNFRMYENPGKPCEGRKGAGKWGVILGIRSDVQVLRRITTPASLRGRVVALDIVISGVSNSSRILRLIGLYAPWNPGADDDSSRFWSEITTLCQPEHHTTFDAWQIIGDCNVVLSRLERTSGLALSPNAVLARSLYTDFLSSASGWDLWDSNPNRSASSHYTHTLRGPSRVRSILDRSAVSVAGVLAGSIRVLSDRDLYIPADADADSDHRPILSSISFLSGPSALPFELSFANTVMAPGRIMYPRSNKAATFTKFSETISQYFQAHPLPLDSEPHNEAEFDSLYRPLTAGILSVSESVFGRKSRAYDWNRTISSPTIRSRVLTLKSLGRAIYAFRTSADNRFERIPRYLFHKLVPLFAAPSPAGVIIAALRTESRSLASQIYQEAKELAITKRNQFNKAKMLRVLNGASSKQLLPSVYSADAPRAVQHPESGALLTDPAQVKAAHVSYFQKLYNHPDPPANYPKPWLSSPSVVEVRNRVLADPFVWPSPDT